MTDDYAVSLYYSTNRLSTQASLVPVQLRLAYVAIHRLREQLGPEFHILADYICVTSVCTSGDTTSPENVGRLISEWSRKGKQYDSIAASLGGTDALLVLPEDISPTVWERLPVIGDDRDNMITALLNRGIKTAVKECDHVTELIFGHLTYKMMEWIQGNFLTWAATNNINFRSKKPTRSKSNPNGRPVKRRNLSSHCDHHITKVLQESSMGRGYEIQENSACCQAAHLAGFYVDSAPFVKALCDAQRQPSSTNETFPIWPTRLSADLRKYNVPDIVTRNTDGGGGYPDKDMATELEKHNKILPEILASRPQQFQQPVTVTKSDAIPMLPYWPWETELVELPLVDMR
ncbi:hypothetical protein M441DRAFT_394338 [Trichoderma asperellum CBS 433.97]|uniref:Uncharacterized protein n=1 Tax=Trichoderma asperellum (strain ATCC 204424 / CBS 433.97 / NBRC 101777) TaxID=1042311 RepID=A0A2T3ZD65_TRIA4|nr:hypothetical protein M441DRAFT_394338 [Trichoderma asperellum CBS 433.97]PTB42743.1 hypothetical protein M441DRAFT_394338 [Trichoderma asperellum CBS 433.97]